MGLTFNVVPASLFYNIKGEPLIFWNFIQNEDSLDRINFGLPQFEMQLQIFQCTYYPISLALTNHCFALPSKMNVN